MTPVSIALDELMRKCREEQHTLTYADLQALRATASDREDLLRAADYLAPQNAADCTVLFVPEAERIAAVLRRLAA